MISSSIFSNDNWRMGVKLTIWCWWKLDEKNEIMSPGRNLKTADLRKRLQIHVASQPLKGQNSINLIFNKYTKLKNIAHLPELLKWNPSSVFVLFAYSSSLQALIKDFLQFFRTLFVVDGSCEYNFMPNDDIFFTLLYSPAEPVALWMFIPEARMISKSSNLIDHKGLMLNPYLN